MDDPGFLGKLLTELVPSAAVLGACLKALFWGGLAGYIFISATEYEEDGKRLIKQFSVNVKDKLSYSFLGGILSLMFQAATTEPKVLFIQAITVGAAWPYFIRKFGSKRALGKFIESGDDVPVEEKDA